MAFEDHKKQKNNDCEFILNAVSRYGLPLFIFYAILGVTGAAIDYLRSLDERYNIVESFGLDRII